jgi:hypothetical protein
MPRVSDFTAASLPLTGAETVYLVQGGNSRKTTVGEIWNADRSVSRVKLQAAVVAAGQTELTQTGIPSWVNRITISFASLSTNGTSVRQVQIGNGSFVTTGYTGGQGTIGAASAAGGTLSTGFALGFQNRAADVFSGHMTITRLTGNTWVASALGGGASGNIVAVAGGSIALAGALDRLRVTTVSGTDTFDVGSVSVSWE